MAESLRPFENSLREFLLNVLADSYNSPQALAYKFNNLKVFIDPKRQSVAHFFVSVGISEACFGIENLEKLSGNIGPDERFITRWAGKPNINGELKKTWMILAKAVASVTSSRVGSNDELEEKLKIAEAENQKVEMLGTGVKSRFKSFERYNRRKRWEKH